MNFPADLSEKYFCLNGDILPLEKFSTDLLEGNNIIYEVIRVKQSTPIFLEDHLKRFQHSAASLGYNNINTDEVTSSIRKLLSSNPVKEKNLRVTYYQKFTSRESVLLIYFIPSRYPSEVEKQNGVYVKTLEAERHNPTVKIENKALRAIANEALSTGQCYEVLLVDHNGNITEGSRSNVFFILNKKVVTAPDHLVLGGITRQKVVDICKRNSLQLEFKCLNINEIGNISGCFITGTSPGVLPVSKIDSINLSKIPGIIYQIADEYEKMVNTCQKNWR
ncbi:MAG: branched-chain amino acid aminotransferase [Tenuifilum sp.]|jgi:branched-chain amino acid aminotransferase|uniref:aminotransferase class IV n=1 Tax=Tenuifilum sp. TaxID=2760880 RepID=UPI0024AAF22F|nr:aminotransferase class IV [Tenuifilum sp.]MDI3527286.1 branched-chain amino acid aminotransferase [Tenuifilum sp.]